MFYSSNFYWIESKADEGSNACEFLLIILLEVPVNAFWILLAIRFEMILCCFTMVLYLYIKLCSDKKVKCLRWLWICSSYCYCWYSASIIDSL